MIKKILVFICFISVCAPSLPTLSAIKNTDKNFLIITDIHLNKDSNHTMDINPTAPIRENDLDYSTFLQLLDSIQSKIQLGVIPTPEFILLLGDLARHTSATPANTLSDEEEVFTKIKTTFPTTPLFYVFGNNDSLVTHYGPFYASTGIGSIHSPYDAAKASDWTDGFLSTGTACNSTAQNSYPCIITDTEDTTYGHYSAYLQSNLRLIVVNSIVFSISRSSQYITEEDAQRELTWVANQLKTAQQQNESVLIATHIPLGYQFYSQKLDWVAANHASFLNLLNLYRNNIIGVLGGHIHSEELRIIRTSTNQNVIPMLFSPALSTSHGNAPAVKTFYYHQQGSSWELSNYKVFDFSPATNFAITLQELYDYNTYYCSGDSSKNILQCLSNVTLAKVQQYYTAGNNEYTFPLTNPENLYIDLPADNSVSSSSSNSFPEIAAIALIAGSGVVAATTDKVLSTKTTSK